MKKINIAIGLALFVFSGCTNLDENVYSNLNYS